MHWGPQVPAQRPPTYAWDSGSWRRGRARIAESFIAMGASRRQVCGILKREKKDGDSRRAGADGLRRERTWRRDNLFYVQNRPASPSRLQEVVLYNVRCTFE
jgi:hypothetical protein